MSKTTKRKHVAKEVLEEHVIPEGSQQIVRVVAGRGNNLHEVEDVGGEKFLVSMPTKFRKSIWIKRGDYVMVEPIEEGGKVKAEIVHILYKHHIKYLKQERLWPKEFSEEDTDPCVNSAQTKLDPDNEKLESSDDDDDDDLFINTNRPNINLDHTDTNSSDSESNVEEDGK